MNGMGIIFHCRFYHLCVFFSLGCFPTQARPTSARRRRPIVFGIPRRCPKNNWYSVVAIWVFPKIMVPPDHPF